MRGQGEGSASHCIKISIFFIEGCFLLLVSSGLWHVWRQTRKLSF